MKLLAVLVAVAVAVAAVSAVPLRHQHQPVDTASIKRIHMESIKERLAKAGVSEPWPPATVNPLNVSQYLGLWYNVYANLLVLSTFSNNSFCATATYGPVDAATGHVHVFNWERQYSTSGNIRNISGFAYQPHPNTEPGELSVTLYGAGADAPYWIFKVGPVVDDQYQWAIVSDPFYLTLFILTRDLTRWTNKYEQEVLAEAAKLGFTGIGAPIQIAQGPACNYE